MKRIYKAPLLEVTLVTQMEVLCLSPLDSPNGSSLNPEDIDDPDLVQSKYHRFDLDDGDSFFN